MDYFDYRGDTLYAEDVPVADIAAEFGTPCFVYSRRTLERHWHAFDKAIGDRPHLICFAVKANGNIGVLNVLARLGSGFDIVSVGELERVLRAGGDPAKVVFSGVGKRADEMRRALEVGIRCFNVESEPELQRLNGVAADMGVLAPVSIRVNPDVDAQTHPYIATGLRENKFGISVDDALEVYRRAAAMSNIDVQGIDCHIGSQLTQLEPFVAAAKRVLALVDRLAKEGIALHHIDVGGGLGIRYRDETPAEPAAYAAALADALDDRDIELVLEPGRAIAGNAGVLLTRVEYLKDTGYKQFAIVDAAMNDLLRPSLYDSWQEVWPAQRDTDAPVQCYDLVGPICETGDFLAKDRKLALAGDDLLAIRSAGAYGMSMSSNYNARPRAAEVLVDGDRVHLVRARESCEDLTRGEQVAELG